MSGNGSLLSHREARPNLDCLASRLSPATGLRERYCFPISTRPFLSSLPLSPLCPFEIPRRPAGDRGGEEPREGGRGGGPDRGATSWDGSRDAG